MKATRHGVKDCTVVNVIHKPCMHTYIDFRSILISDNYDVVCTPAHVGALGNERADKLENQKQKSKATKKSGSLRATPPTMFGNNYSNSGTDSYYKTVWPDARRSEGHVPKNARASYSGCKQDTLNLTCTKSDAMKIDYVRNEGLKRPWNIFCSTVRSIINVARSY